MNDDPDAREPEQPVRELVDLERETAPDFLSRVRNKITRRTAASQFASYSWHIPKMVLVEMASMLSHVLTEFSGRKRS
jgi:hypothetical protein